MDIIKIKDNSYGIPHIKALSITDITGRLIYSTTAKTINCSSFAKGVYFITLTTENGKAAKKFVKE